MTFYQALPMQITLAEIKAKEPCARGWGMVTSCRDHESSLDPFPMAALLDTNDIFDFLWASWCRPEFADEWRRLAVMVAALAVDTLRPFTWERQILVDSLDVAFSWGSGYKRTPDILRLRDRITGLATSGRPCSGFHTNRALAAIASGCLMDSVLAPQYLDAPAIMSVAIRAIKVASLVNGRLDDQKWCENCAKIESMCRKFAMQGTTSRPLFKDSRP